MPDQHVPRTTRKRPSTRRTRQGTARGEQIIQAASDLFLTHGFDRVSLDDIIARAGGSKTNIYSQFGSKEGLFIAIFKRLFDAMNTRLRQQDLTGLSLEEGLRVLGRTLLSTLLEDWYVAAHRLIIAESVRLPELARAWAEHGPEASYRLLTEFIDAHRQAGTVAVPDARRSATLFHDMIVFEKFYKSLCGLAGPATQDELGRHVDEAVNVFMHGCAHQSKHHEQSAAPLTDRDP